MDRLHFADRGAAYDAGDFARALNELRPGLPGVEMNTTIFRPATFVETAIHNLTHSLLLGIIQVGITFNHYLAVTDAARAAARQAVVAGRGGNETVPATLPCTMISRAVVHEANEGGMKLRFLLPQQGSVIERRKR